MKKIVSILLLLVSFGLSAQFTFDSVVVYHRNFAIDSIYVRGVTQFNSIDTITYSNVALDICATTPFFLVFKGCTTPSLKVIDTTYVFPTQTVWSKKIHLYAAWDTSTLCVNPIAPSYLDTLDWIPCFATDIEELHASEYNVLIFPNPAKNKVYIETDFDFASTQIFNLTGNLVKTVDASSKEINLQELPSGLYFVRIELSNGKEVTKKLVVQHE